ncbi:MAG TPA: asparaginase, partial [Chthonomonadales bacterium]|nr:asparaginase [Chthonomonadales bacterium]
GPLERIDVRLMQVTGGRIIAKTGAEGLLCLGLRAQGRGIAVKILDGNPRALGPVTITALERIGWLTPEEAIDPRLEELKRPKLLGPGGEVVGEIRLAEL